MPFWTGLLNFPVTPKERQQDTVVLIREVLCYPVLLEVKSSISLRTCLVLSKGNFFDNALLLRDTDLICFGWVKSSPLHFFPFFLFPTMPAILSSHGQFNFFVL